VTGRGLGRLLSPALLAASLIVDLVPAEAGHARPQAEQNRAQQPSGVADPLAWVRAAYASSPGSGSEANDSDNPAYTPRLRSLFADEEKYADGEVGRLEFNYMTGAQDDDISELKLEERQVDGAPDRKIVTASFRNIGKPTAIQFLFERSGERWCLDDVHSSPDGWTLSLILKYGVY
jgi:hypothetical protein